jgi:choloylglycine hydrolase
MIKLRIDLIVTLFIILFSINTIASACTDFRIIAKDNSVLITRSMEYGVDMKSNLRSSTRGRIFTTIAPDGHSGLSWKAKYGYLFLDALNVDAALDGMNEAGLSVESLYLPNFAGYQTVPSNLSNQALPYLNFADWVLSNFKTVDEVRKALSHVYVFAQKVTGMGDMIFPLHFSIYEASGKGIVVEYIAGQLRVYEHIGVMTNSPSYSWHLTNLTNYLNLTPVNPPSIVTEGLQFTSNGQGFGMLGLPGDASPPSRFVKIATLLRVAIPVDTIISAINLAEHIINNVDIPLGLVREPNSGNATNETTQWVVFKDLTHHVLYYRTYADLSLRAVSLDKINFTENAPRLKMPLARTAVAQDLTEQFSKAVQ